MVARPKQYVPDRGDVIWLTFEETAGHEQSKRRPALVLSPSIYAKRSGLALVAPITSRTKGYPFEVATKGKKHDGVVLSDQVRAVDWKARRAVLVERALPRVLMDVQAKLVALLTE